MPRAVAWVPFNDNHHADCCHSIMLVVVVVMPGSSNHQAPSPVLPIIPDHVLPIIPDHRSVPACLRLCHPSIFRCRPRFCLVCCAAAAVPMAAPTSQKRRCLRDLPPPPPSWTISPGTPRVWLGVASRPPALALYILTTQADNPSPAPCAPQVDPPGYVTCPSWLLP